MTAKEKNIRKLLSLLLTLDEHKAILRNTFFNSMPDNNISKKIYEEIFVEINLDDLYNEYVKIYSDIFTEKEVRDLLLFYDSPLGKKVLKNTAKVASRTMEAGKRWLANFLNKEENNMREKIDKIIREEVVNENDLVETKDEIDLNNIVNINSGSNVSKDGDSMVEARYLFSQRYVKSKGWNMDDLSLEQIMEIRSQEGWINPKIK